MIKASIEKVLRALALSTFESKLMPLSCICRVCGQLALVHLICILLYASAHDRASLLGTVSHVTRSAK